MRRKLLLGTLGLLMAGLVGLILYIKYSDHRETVERLVSDALGRRLIIAGPFETQVALNTHLVAEDITLVNPAWSHEPALVHVDRLEGSIDLWSLVRGPVRLGNVRIQGARVSLEADGEGHASWQFHAGGDHNQARSDGSDLDRLFRTAELRDVTLTYRHATPEPTLEIHVDRLVMRSRSDGMLDVEGSGAVNQAPVELTGRLGTFSHLVRGEQVDHELRGRYAGAEFSLGGRIGDFVGLRDPDVRLEIQGPDLAGFLVALGLPGDLTGPFRMAGELTPASGDVQLALDVDLGDLSTRIQGTVDALLHPSKLQLEVVGSGPDLTVVPGLQEIQGLPAGRFAIAGDVHHEGHTTMLRKFRVQVGGNDLSLDGVVGDLPDLSGSDLFVDLQGPDLSSFSTLARTELPAHPFRIAGHVVHNQGTTNLEDVEVQLGSAALGLAGELGDWPEFTGTKLDFHLTCPDASVFSVLTRRELPRVPVDVRGRIRPGKKHHVVEDLKATFGSDTLELDGTVVTVEGFVGSDLALHLSGPDLSLLALVTGRDDYPEEPFDIAGHFRVLGNSYLLDDVRVQVGSTTMKLDGTLVPLADLKGSDLHVQADGPDATKVAALVGLEGWPAQPFHIDGDLQVLDQGYRVESMEATIGDLDVKVDGQIGPLPDASGTEIDFEGEAEDLSTLAGLFGVETLPAEKFSVRGHARFEEGGYRLENVMVRVGPAHLEAHGFLGALPDAYGTDLSVKAEGPDGVLLGNFLGVELPHAPLSASGRVQHSESGTYFHDVKIDSGGYRAEINGSLGPWPKLIGTRLDVSAEGPGLELFSQFFDVPVEDAPFTLSGHFDGTPEQFAVRDFAATLGNSDLSGSLRLDLTDKPVLRGNFTSKRINTLRLSGLERADGIQPAVEEDADPDAGPPLLIPDNPIELGWLDRFDAELHWGIDELNLPVFSLNHTSLDLSLQDSRLEVGLLQGEGVYGGTVSGSIAVEPDGQAYRMAAQFRAEHLRLSPASDERGLQPTPYDAQLDLTGTGKSLHGMASTADGRVIIFQDEGSFDNRALHLLTTDALATVIAALNPFSKKERYTGIVCGVHVTHVEDGVARLDPLAIVTDKMKIAGRGRIYLETERLDLSWTAKPRRGIGLSASMITNPYVKLGGTLSNPQLTVKPLQAAGATAAAFGTAGLSLLAKGFWDRFTSTKRVCKKAGKKYGID